MTSLSGFSRVCGKKSGGVKTLYLVTNAELTSMTLTLKKWTAITMANSAKFKKYEFERGECEFKEEVATENDSLKVTHTVEFYLAKMTQTSRDAVEEIATESACGMVGIAVDMNGNQWVIGYSNEYLKEFPLTLGSAASTSGKLLTDKNGTTITLLSEDAEMARVYTGSIPV